MTREPKAFADFLRKMVAIANANEAEMDGTTGPVREIIDGAELVFGIWQDQTWPHGIGWLLIKGQQHMREGFADNVAKRLQCAAIKCAGGAEQAEAARQLFGEVDRIQ
jgi:hypothetical protein